MALETYRKKRNFAATAEPKGAAPLADSNMFVVQKHDATRLHYDFRLALDGVLKSWAVTRGPSLNPGEKRLAVAVEDHPLEYADFEGTIAKGEYGGGAVIVWDNGTWAPIGDAHRGLKKGHLEFELHGRKLKGRWHLVRMHGKPGEKRENWLLIKGDDEFARSVDEADILEERPESINTGRTIDQLEGEAPGWSSKTGRIEKPDGAGATAKPKSGAHAREAPDPSAIDGVVKGPLPGFVEPMLATLAKSPPTGDRWLHEIKFDGYRLQAHIEDGSGYALDSGRARLDEKIRRSRARGAAKPAGAHRLDRRRAGGRERERRLRVLASASRSQRGTARPVRLLRLRLSLSRRIRFAPSGAHPPQGAAPAS